MYYPVFKFFVFPFPVKLTAGFLYWKSHKAPPPSWLCWFCKQILWRFVFGLLSKLRCCLEEVQFIRQPAWLCVAPKQSLCTALESHEGEKISIPQLVRLLAVSCIWTAAKLWAPIFTSSNCTYTAAKATLLLALAPTQPVRMLIKQGPKPKKARKDVSDDDVSNELQTRRWKKLAPNRPRLVFWLQLSCKWLLGLLVVAGKTVA